MGTENNKNGNKPENGNKPAALIFILIAVMINSISFGIIVPVLPDLIKSLTGLENHDAVIHGGWLIFIFAVLQFICLPLAGGLSDRYGRRPIMLISLSGLTGYYLLMAFAPTLGWLYLARIMAGTFSATFTTANAYIADVSPPETRAQNFGLVGACFGVGFLLGPVIGGLLGEFGPRLPFIAAGIIAAANVVLGYVFLPESLPKDKRRPFSILRANPIGSIIALKRIRGVKGLIFVLFMLATAHTVYPTTYTFSLLEGLDWSSGDVGLSLGAFAVCQMVVQGGLIRIVVPKFGLFWVGVIGITSAIIAYIVLGSADRGWIIYAAGPFAALAGLHGPALTNMMSQQISETQQGELQGAIGAAQGLAMMSGPLLMTGAFAVFGNRANPANTELLGFPDNLSAILYYKLGQAPLPYIPGAPFLLAGGFALLAGITYLFVTTKADRKARLPVKTEPTPIPK